MAGTGSVYGQSTVSERVRQASAGPYCIPAVFLSRGPMDLMDSDGTATAIRGRWRPADGVQSVWLHSRSSGLSATGSACKLSPAAEGGSRPEVSKHWGMV